MNIKIKTWNLLVPKYCTKETYERCNEEDLNNTKRYQLIKKQLKNDINNGLNIFLLQEVSFAWSDKLKIFFLENNFSTYEHNYGYWGNDYMGVMIAWNNKDFKALELQKNTVADSLYIKIPENTSYKTYYYYKSTEWIKYFGSNITNFINKNIVKYEDNYFKKIQTSSDIKIAYSRKNVLLNVRLKDNNNRQFNVSTYHMPCLFDNLYVMNKHMNTCLKIINLFSKKNFGIPFIFGGDFNSQPNSEVYKILSDKMTSVNKDDEPNTVYSFHKMFGEFKGCIDYIFHSKGFDKIKRYEYEKIDNYMPNKIYPSDHRSLKASFNL